ncbi:MAG: patatin-like phospholipase family protein [Hyphomicrobiaceae bacterium]|nr:patatin-like phospholipase family protein [Hyphomicrobiaceae bacterium]
MPSTPDTSTTQKPETAFVLAGGGSFGAVQVGMLKALARAGVVPDLVVGSSVGAYNAALFASDPTVEGAERLARIWHGIRRQDAFPITLSTLWRFVWRGDVLVSSTGLKRLIDAHLPCRRIEETRVPLHIVATDFFTGQPRVLSQGPAREAILASSAIPAAFAPVRIGDRYLVDGAVTSNTPVRIAVKLGARRLVVLPTGFACDLKSPPRGAIPAAMHALTLLIARQLVFELESLDPSISFAIVPTLCPLDGSPYDFSRTAELMESAQRLAEEWIDAGGLDSSRVPDQLRPHHHGENHDHDHHHGHDHAHHHGHHHHRDHKSHDHGHAHHGVA